MFCCPPQSTQSCRPLPLLSWACTSGVTSCILAFHSQAMHTNSLCLSLLICKVEPIPMSIVHHRVLGRMKRVYGMSVKQLR